MKKDKQEMLDKELREFLRIKPLPVHIYRGKQVSFGVVSDTHLGSLYEHLDVLNLAYKTFRNEGIKVVYHAGDMCEGNGKLFRGQAYEIYAHGADAQIKNCVAKYPKFQGITTYWISGSHDLSFHKTDGLDIGEHIQEKRPDLVYLGREEQDVAIAWRGKQVRIRLVHPGVGTAYALSYHVQKYVESLSGGQKPNILLYGHTHKALYVPCYRNVFSFCCGCIQGQTPFMRRKNLASHVGFWIVRFRIDPDGGVASLQAEFFAHYEERKETKIKG